MKKIFLALILLLSLEATAQVNEYLIVGKVVEARTHQLYQAR